jgi:hypothetical protein
VNPGPGAKKTPEAAPAVTIEPDPQTPALKTTAEAAPPPAATNEATAQPPAPKPAPTPEKTGAETSASPPPAPLADDEEIVDGLKRKKLGSKFISDEHVQKLLKHIGTDTIADELAQVLALTGKGSTTFAAADAEKKTKASLTLGVNGHTIEFDHLEDGREFMGLSSAHAGVFDAHDARALVGLAKSRGWQSITVHGHQDHKESLWLEAQRMNIKVEGFEPKPDSAVAQVWAKEQALLAQRKAQDPDAAPTVTPAAAPQPVRMAVAPAPKPV